MEKLTSYKRRLLELDAVTKTLLSERDPENVDKRLDAEAAQAKFLEVTDTPQDAIRKALLGTPASPATAGAAKLPEALTKRLQLRADVAEAEEKQAIAKAKATKAKAKPDPIDSISLTNRVRKLRERS